MFDADGLPGTGTTSHWEVVSGPGTVAFEPHPIGNTAVSDAEDPTVTFSTIGVYVLRLTGSDGLLSATDDVTIVVSDDIDLTVQSIDTAAFEVDRRTLEVSGTLSAQVANLGEASTSIEFSLLFFEDVEDATHALNGVYDPGVDRIVAQSQVQALAGGASVIVTTPATGDVSFAGIPIHAFVDSTLAITETDETNNVLSSIGQCILSGSTEFVAPSLVQQWLGSSISPNSANVMMTPVVADVNLDGRSDIIFISAPELEDNATLRAITWNDSNPNANELFSLGVEGMTMGPIAVGNISGDAHPEILAQSESDELVVFAYNSATSQYQELWRRAGGGSPVLADLNGDGFPEIISGYRIYNNDGSYYLDEEDFPNHHLPETSRGLPIVADLDAAVPGSNGLPEIIFGNVHYRNSSYVISIETSPINRTPTESLFIKVRMPQ